MGALTPAEYAVLLDRAGITPDKPLHAVMTAAFEQSQGARALTPEAEKNLVARVVAAVRSGAEQAGAQAYRQWRLRTWAILAAAGVVVGVGGIAAGRMMSQDSRSAAAAGASFVAQVAALNDAEAMRAYCVAHAYQQEGGTACQLPPVWIRR